jgi:hypothetical protein
MPLSPSLIIIRDLSKQVPVVEVNPELLQVKSRSRGRLFEGRSFAVVEPFIVLEGKERGVKPIECITALSPRGDRRLHAVATTTATVGREIPDRELRVSGSIHLFQRKKLPVHLNALFSQLPFDLL